MARFTKYNNPNKKRYPRKKDYTDRMIDAGRDMLLDHFLGYGTEPVEYYEKKAGIKHD